MTALDVRTMTPQDMADVVGVWRRSRRDAQPWLEERMNRSVSEDVEQLGHVVRLGEIWVAVDAERIVGVMALVDARLDMLYVDPAAQGRGVGSALMDRAMRRSPAGLTLFTHQRNARARAFYERRGFEVVRLGLSPPPESEPDVLYAWTPAPG